MNKQQFLNRLKSLYCIDGYLLPELTPEQQMAFMADPVRYLLRTSNLHADAIWREVENRQHKPSVN